MSLIGPITHDIVLGLIIALTHPLRVWQDKNEPRPRIRAANADRDRRRESSNGVVLGENIPHACPPYLGPHFAHSTGALNRLKRQLNGMFRGSMRRIVRTSIKIYHLPAKSARER